MTPCVMCLWDYPAGLVNPLITLHGQIDLCGICALAFSNELHGIERKRFDGHRAEQIRLDCLKWRKDHPDQKPVAEVGETTPTSGHRTPRATRPRRPSKRRRRVHGG